MGNGVGDVMGLGKDGRAFFSSLISWGSTFIRLTWCMMLSSLTMHDYVQYQGMKLSHSKDSLMPVYNSIKKGRGFGSQ